MRRLSIAAISALLALGGPASALGQSAGDDQYRDPFAGDEGRPSEQPENSGTETQDVAPAPVASTPAAPEASSSSADTLPYTGLPAAAVAGLGALLLAAGVGLRRSSR